MSDCDYRRHRAVILKGKTQIAAWLRKRFADRDNLTIGRIWNEVPYQDEAAGVDYERRVSVLFPNGIVPKVQTKVVFARSGRIAGFANGPGGAPADQRRDSAVRSGSGVIPARWRSYESSLRRVILRMMGSMLRPEVVVR
jgi:hypothetical protein